MSYYIAEELTIMPDKIISVGYSNNVFPRESVVSEIPRTDLEIEYIVRDLIGGMIQPRQEWWKSTQQLLREKFSWEDMDHKEKKQEAAQFLLNQYDTQILINLMHTFKRENEKIPTCMEYRFLLDHYVDREDVTIEKARDIVGQWTSKQWFYWLRGRFNKIKFNDHDIPRF